jgi:hypothetical protein
VQDNLEQDADFTSLVRDTKGATHADMSTLLVEPIAFDGAELHYAGPQPNCGKPFYGKTKREK